MPIFEFKCLDCEHVFEKLFINSDEEINLFCPECKSQTLQRVVSRTNYAVGCGANEKKAELTTKTCGGQNQCMTLNLPGHTR